MPTPHKHAEVIRAWADGQEIEYKKPDESHWGVVGIWPGWNESWEYRIKPAAPKWPQTTMAEDSILSAWYNGNDVRGPSAEIWAMIRVANTAIAHACETGALVPADKVREIEAKARAEGMKDGSVWDGDRDRMVIRETLKAQGISWTPHLVDHVIYRLPK